MLKTTAEVTQSEAVITDSLREMHNMIQLVACWVVTWLLHTNSSMIVVTRDDNITVWYRVCQCGMGCL